MGNSNFPSTEWCWDISKKRIQITHQSGLAFVTPVLLNRCERLQGQEHRIYGLTEKDVNLISYTVDYFLNKAYKKIDNPQKAIVLATNIICAYRFRIPFESKLFTENLSLCTKEKHFRKFGEHIVLFGTKELKVFVIGHGPDVLNAITVEEKMDEDSKILLYEHICLPRFFFERM